MKGNLCELCREEANLYCVADSAFLCWDCDAKVHGANFLVARHVRHTICSNCRSLSDNCLSGAPSPIFRNSYCRSCSPETDTNVPQRLRMISSSSSSSLDRLSSCESSSTVCRKRKNIRLDKRSGTPKTNKIISPSSSVSDVSSDKDWDARARFRGWRKVDDKAEGIFVNWCKKMGLNEKLVVSLASWALGLCLARSAEVPYRVSLAASFWLGLRISGNRSSATWQNLRRLEQVSGVPAKLVVAVGMRLARAMRSVRERPGHDMEEGWADSHVQAI